MIYFIIVILIILFYFRVTDNFSSNILPYPLLVLNNKLIYETDKLYSKINPIVYNKNKLNNLITKKCKNNTNINNYNIGTVKKSYTNMKNYDKICNYKDAIFRDKLWKCHGNQLPKNLCNVIASEIILPIESCKENEFKKDLTSELNLNENTNLNAFYN